MSDVTTQSTQALQLKMLDLGDPTTWVQAANQLANFIKTNNLTVKIQQKDYPLVEAWQFLFRLTNLRYVVEEPVELPGAPSVELFYENGASRGWTKAEIVYKAICWIYDAGGNVVGKGSAICSNAESKKKDFDRYAVYSFVQTRAIAKSGRNMFAYIMKLAGYEATPAEEEGTSSFSAAANEAGTGAEVLGPPTLQAPTGPLEVPLPLQETTPAVAAAAQTQVANPPAGAPVPPPSNLPPALQRVVDENPNVHVVAPPAAAAPPAEKAKRGPKPKPADSAAPAAVAAAAPVAPAAPAPAPIPQNPPAPPAPAPVAAAAAVPSATPPVPTAAPAIANSGKTVLSQVVVNKMLGAVQTSGQVAYNDVVARLPVYEVSPELLNTLNEGLTTLGFNPITL